MIQLARSMLGFSHDEETLSPSPLELVFALHRYPGFRTLFQNQEASPLRGIQTGDIVFQDTGGATRRSGQSCDGSDFTHCGVVFKSEGELYVFEAIQPVSKWFPSRNGRRDPPCSTPVGSKNTAEVRPSRHRKLRLGAKNSSESPTTSISSGVTIPSTAPNWSGKSTKRAPESPFVSPKASNPTFWKTQSSARSSVSAMEIWTNSLKKSPWWLPQIWRPLPCSSRFPDVRIGAKSGLCEKFHKVALRRVAGLA